MMMHAELFNLWLFFQAIAKESVITGIAPVALFEILYAKLAEPKRWPRPKPDPEPNEDDDWKKAAIGVAA